MWAGSYADMMDLMAAEVPGSRDVEANAKILRGMGQRRQAVALVQEIAAKVSTAKAAGGVAEVLTWAQDRIQALMVSSDDKSLGHCLTDAMAAGEAYAAMRDQGGKLAASWGIRELDLLCPLRPGMLCILAAEPGGGKTTLGLQAAKETADELGMGAVAIASLEMIGQELATILAGRQAGIAPAAIREKSASLLPADWACLAELAAAWTDSPAILVRDTSATGEALTVDSLVAWLTQRKHASPRMGLAVLDYLQLLDAPNPRWTEYQTITHASRKLKRAAQSLRIPILCLSQMNRDGRKAIKAKDGTVQGMPEPTLSDLRGSGSIEQDADAVIFLHVVGNPEPSAATVLVRAIVAKQRGGAKGSVDLWFHRKHAKLTAAEPRDVASPDEAKRERADRMRSLPSPSEECF
jgi:replicative DNA helicase